MRILALSLLVLSGCAGAAGGFEHKLFSRNRNANTATAKIVGDFDAAANGFKLRIKVANLPPAEIVRPRSKNYRVWFRSGEGAPWTLVGVLDYSSGIDTFKVPGKVAEIWVTPEIAPTPMGPTYEPVFARVVRAP